VLNSGPIFSPDVLFNTLQIQDTPGEVSPSESPPGTSSTHGGVLNGEMIAGRGFSRFPNWRKSLDTNAGLHDLTDNSLIPEIFKKFQEPDIIKFRLSTFLPLFIVFPHTLFTSLSSLPQNECDEWWIPFQL